MQAFNKWRSEHTTTVLSVRQAVNDGATSEGMLRQLVEEARGQLWTLFAMKKAVICSESVLIIMNMEHLLPAVSLRCTHDALRVSPWVTDSVMLVCAMSAAVLGCACACA